MERTISNCKVAFIGSGNVATNFAKALKDKTDIIQIYSSTLANAERLARIVGCNNFTNNPDNLTPYADIYIVAVKDDALNDIAQQFKGWGGLWLHTSGTTDMLIFAHTRENYGVLYPLQTLTRSKDLMMSDVPMFIEANNDDNLETVKSLAETMGATDIKKCSSIQRMKLHIAAVFACNFVNHILMHSQQLLQNAGTELSALAPLIKETIGKAISDENLETAQTGPARRGDMNIIDKHIAALDGEKKELYTFLSNEIIRHYQ